MILYLSNNDTKRTNLFISLLTVITIFLGIKLISMQQELNMTNSIIYENNKQLIEANETIIGLETSYNDLKNNYSKLALNYRELENDYNSIIDKIVGYEEVDHSKLNSIRGVNYYDGHKETYYNLPMNRIVSIAQYRGYEGKYWVRKDGVKMFGLYVMVAADQSKYPYGTIVETSLGEGIIVDTGTFINSNSEQFDIAVTW